MIQSYAKQFLKIIKYQKFGIWEMNFLFQQWGKLRIKFCLQSYLRDHIQ